MVMSGGERLENIIPPVRVTVDGAEVAILEVMRLEPAGKLIGYHVTVEAKVDGEKTPRFFVTATSWDDLIRKLRIEIAKWRVLKMSGW